MNKESDTNNEKERQSKRTLSHRERRENWASDYLGCDPNTGEPSYQELITIEDLVRAMEVEAKYWKDRYKVYEG